MNIQAILVRGPHTFLVQFESFEEFNSEWPLMKKAGFRPIGESLLASLPVAKVEKDEYGFMDDLDVQEAGPSCPTHGTERIWADKGDKRKKYCGVKVNDRWCGAKWNENGKMVQGPK